MPDRLPRRNPEKRETDAERRCPGSYPGSRSCRPQRTGTPRRSKAQGTGSFLPVQAAAPADHPASERRIVTSGCMIPLEERVDERSHGRTLGEDEKARNQQEDQDKGDHPEELPAPEKGEEFSDHTHSGQETATRHTNLLVMTRDGTSAGERMSTTLESRIGTDR